MNSSVSSDVYLTQDGLDNLRKEYDELINVKRKKITEEIAATRELGDLSENSAWQRARDEQSFIEGRISELEEILKDAKVIQKSDDSDVVSLGSKVRVKIDGDEEEFHIVGGPEADPKQQKISHESPLGKALIGRKIGETVEIEAPIGNIRYKIVSIK